MKITFILFYSRSILYTMDQFKLVQSIWMIQFTTYSFVLWRANIFFTSAKEKKIFNPFRSAGLFPEYCQSIFDILLSILI